MPGQQLPGDTEQVVRSEPHEPRKACGYQQRCEQHEPEHGMGIGSRTRDLKWALNVHPCLDAFEGMTGQSISSWQTCRLN